MIIMKTSAVKSILFMVPLLIMGIGCSESSDEEELVPELKYVDSTKIAVASEGGSYQINYQLINPVAGGEIYVTNSAEWIKDIDTGKEGIITFRADSNIVEEERNATLRVLYSYSGPVQSFDVNVVQAPAVPVPDFTIEVTDTTSKSATLYITAKNDKMFHVVRVLPKDEFEAFATDNDVFENDVNYFNTFVYLYGVSYYEALGYNGMKGDGEFPISGLNRKTEYYAYTYGMTETSSPVMLSKVYKVQFTTPDVEGLTDMTLDMNVTVQDKNNVKVAVTPSDPDHYYYVGVLMQFDWDLNYEGTPEEKIIAIVKDNVANHMAFGFTLDNIKGVFKGSIDEVFNVYGGDSCVVVAAPVNEEGICCGKTVYKEVELVSK